MCCITVNDVPFNHVKWSKHLLFNSNATSSYFHSASEPFAKDQNARGGTPIYHVPQPSSLIKYLTCLTFALTFWVNLLTRQMLLISVTQTIVIVIGILHLCI